ncbi:MAG TPA: hypothetical protein VFB55_07185 [Verrucomicrobiae bacterium]|nr:hypothetical protein [Verrucomicrobiae bacterium]
MNLRVTHWLWLSLALATLFLAAGCASTEPDNASTRPWNTPQGWEGGLPIMDQQHP